MGEKLLWEEAESKTRLGKGDVQTIKATAIKTNHKSYSLQVLWSKGTGDYEDLSFGNSISVLV